MCSEQDAQVHKTGEPGAVFDHKLHTIWLGQWDFPDNLDNFLSADKIPGFLLSVYQQFHTVF